jgi:crossover junction endodeoxyribonuclease RuvC
MVGYGLVKIEEDLFKAIDYGYFQTNKKLVFPERLRQIHEFVSDLLNKTQPDVVAIEEVYVSSNAKTTLRLGHARGVIVLSSVEAGVPVADYAPREIKKAVIGTGGATKDQVQWMMCQMLHIDKNSLTDDAADGLAVALCHGLRSKSKIDV